MASPTAPTEGEVTPLVGLDVLAWRYGCLVGAGYPADEACILAELPTVDLHVAVDLLRQGATVEQAVRILL